MGNEIVYDGIRYYPHSFYEWSCRGFAEGFSTTSLHIPEKINDIPVTRIEEAAFANTYIQFLSIPESLEFIDENAFAKCKDLESIYVFPVNGFQEQNVLNIKENAFMECANLVEIRGAERTVRLDKFAFHLCESLIHLGFKIQSLQPFALDQCQKLEELNFSGCAIMKQFCLEGTNVKVLKIPHTGILDTQVFERIQDYNIKIRCRPDSNLAELAYRGYSIEIC